jgi:ubiquinone biosynthesis UbiH/UbiF/VisC/COQ6 family hydroxylase
MGISEGFFVQTKAQKSSVYCPITIMGGGLVGSLLGLFLAEQGFSVAIIDACLLDQTSPLSSHPFSDLRAFAFSWQSCQFLDSFPFWHTLEKEPITHIKTSCQGFNETIDYHQKIHPFSQESMPLGMMVKSHDFRLALHQAAHNHPNIGWIQGKAEEIIYKQRPACSLSCAPKHTPSNTLPNSGYTLTFPHEILWKSCAPWIRRLDTHPQHFWTLDTDLLIGADGSDSYIRDHVFRLPQFSYTYPQKALLFSISHELPHNNCALEHFYPKGSLATLPLGHNHSAVVWMDQPATIEKLHFYGTSGPSFQDSFDPSFQKDFCTRDAPSFLLKSLQRHLPHVPFLQKSLQLKTPLQIFPLKLKLAFDTIHKHGVLVGDSAHTIHPIAGQGLNLGLGDVMVLGPLIAHYHSLGLPINSDMLLEAYEKKRRRTVHEMAAFTHGIVYGLSLFPGASSFLWPLALMLLGQESTFGPWDPSFFYGAKGKNRPLGKILQSPLWQKIRASTKDFLQNRAMGMDIQTKL